MINTIMKEYYVGKVVNEANKVIRVWLTQMTQPATPDAYEIREYTPAELVQHQQLAQACVQWVTKGGTGHPQSGLIGPITLEGERK